MMKAFEEVEHTADWAFRAYGKDLPALFENAARAMFALQGSTSDATPISSRVVQVEGTDRETLLVNWLNELLYLQETLHETFSGFEILELTEGRLTARVQSCPQELTKTIKAATFHQLEIKQMESGWEATIVVDV